MSANLLKSESKRKRTKKQIADELEAEEKAKQQSKAKLSQYDVLQAKVKMMEDKKGEGEAALNLLS